MGIDEVIRRGPAVFLDRDGILDRPLVRDGRPFPPGRLEEVEILEGAHTTCARLAQAGYALIAITNQPDVARGTQSRETVEAINALLLSRLPLLEIFVCYHDDVDDCPCRKPRPGLILMAARKHGIALAGSWMVGDRWKDIAAGRAAGLRTIFVDYHYAEQYMGAAPEFIVEDVGLVADIVLEGPK